MFLGFYAAENWLHANRMPKQFVSLNNDQDLYINNLESFPT